MNSHSDLETVSSSGSLQLVSWPRPLSPKCRKRKVLFYWLSWSRRPDSYYLHRSYAEALYCLPVTGTDVVLLHLLFMKKETPPVLNSFLNDRLNIMSSSVLILNQTNRILPLRFRPALVRFAYISGSLSKQNHWPCEALSSAPHGHLSLKTWPWDKKTGSSAVKFPALFISASLWHSCKLGSCVLFWTKWDHRCAFVWGAPTSRHACAGTKETGSFEGDWGFLVQLSFL